MMSVMQVIGELNNLSRF